MSSGDSPSRLADYLRHIEQAATDACQFLAGSSKAEFVADKRTQGAVIMSLVVIGEAATRLMDQHGEFVQQHPEVPWRSMRGMRNRIAHGYFDIDLNIVWETVQTALPRLLQQLAQVRDGLQRPSEDPAESDGA